MRDPDARIRIEPQRVIRELYHPLPAGHFLHHDLSRRWVTEKKLVPFAFEGTQRVVGRRLEFVSQPSEWTDAQLFAAARLTLELQGEAIESGFDLKDGSAWNVLFEGCRPIFCDLMSFGTLAHRRWWAFGQYARHFLLPLLAARHVSLHACNAFTLWRDGMPPEIARRMLGRRVLLSRYAALVARTPQEAHSSTAVEAGNDGSGEAEIRGFRRRLHAAIDWQLRGLAPRASGAAGGWAGYRGDRPHYGGDSLAAKRGVVNEWLTRLAPSWVLDLGCNTGEFSVMALGHGAQVIGLDADHDSVQQLFITHAENRCLHTVVAPLDDLRSSRGWAGREHSGLDHRLTECADAVLMLALIHHLMVGAAVPLDEVARFAHQCTRRALILELIGADDPQLVALCHQRRRTPADFSAQRQLDAFLAAGFSLQAEQPLSGTARRLVLLCK